MRFSCRAVHLGVDAREILVLRTCIHCFLDSGQGLVAGPQRAAKFIQQDHGLADILMQVVDPGTTVSGLRWDVIREAAARDEATSIARVEHILSVQGRGTSLTYFGIW